MGTKKFYETDTFNATRDEWYSKLKDGGFEDIESTDSETVVQPQIFKANKTQAPEGLGYYEFCQKVLREYPFKRDVDLVIFEQHAEGKSVREIEEYLKKTDLKPIKKTTIQSIIERIKQDFGRM